MQLISLCTICAILLVGVGLRGTEMQAELDGDESASTNDARGLGIVLILLVLGALVAFVAVVRYSNRHRRESRAVAPEQRSHLQARISASSFVPQMFGNPSYDGDTIVSVTNDIYDLGTMDRRRRNSKSPSEHSDGYIGVSPTRSPSGDDVGVEKSQ